MLPAWMLPAIPHKPVPIERRCVDVPRVASIHAYLRSGDSIEKTLLEETLSLVSMPWKRTAFVLLAAMFAVLISSPLQAQIVDTGIITGVVRDNTGAILAGAKVAVLSSSTGLASKTTTDSKSIYVSPPLHPGDYDVVVEVRGFSKASEHVRLGVGQRLAGDVTLAVGNDTETVQVQATGELLQTESSSVGNLRTEQAVKDLPLNGRNFADR